MQEVRPSIRRSKKTAPVLRDEVNLSSDSSSSSSTDDKDRMIDDDNNDISQSIQQTNTTTSSTSKNDGSAQSGIKAAVSVAANLVPQGFDNYHAEALANVGKTWATAMVNTQMQIIDHEYRTQKQTNKMQDLTNRIAAEELKQKLISVKSSRYQVSDSDSRWMSQSVSSKPDRSRQSVDYRSSGAHRSISGNNRSDSSVDSRTPSRSRNGTRAPADRKDAQDHSRSHHRDRNNNNENDRRRGGRSGNRSDSSVDSRSPRALAASRDDGIDHRRNHHRQERGSSIKYT